MKIYTGNFANIKKYKDAGLFPISIAVSARYFTGATYRPLNPDRSYMKFEENEYTPLYYNKLEKLNARTVIEDLEKISNFVDVVLLCHESEGTFCHRRLAAEWLEYSLGIEVKELGKMKQEEQMNLF